MNARELKPCPFCGGEARISVGNRNMGRRGCKPFYYVRCNCGAGLGELVGPNETPEEVAEAWNTRAALPEQPLAEKWREEAEALKIKRDTLEDDKSNDMLWQMYMEQFHTLHKCASDLDSHESESLELLRRIVIAADSFNGTRPDMNFEAHVHALGELMKAVDEARKHLEDKSDEA